MSHLWYVLHPNPASQSCCPLPKTPVALLRTLHIVEVSLGYQGQWMSPLKERASSFLPTPPQENLCFPLDILRPSTEPPDLPKHRKVSILAFQIKLVRSDGSSVPRGGNHMLGGMFASVGQKIIAPVCLPGLWMLLNFL